MSPSHDPTHDSTQTLDRTRAFPEGIRTCQGSCRCGAIRFEADMDLSQGTTRCNCTICTKTGWWGFLVRPDAFRLLSGEVTAAKPGGGQKTQCATCNVQPFGHGDIPELGGEFYAINVRCLDDVDLNGVPIKYLDGRHNTWALLAERRYEDPFVGAGDPANVPYAPQES